MSKTKYSALEETLKRLDQDQISMTFSEIERIISAALPLRCEGVATRGHVHDPVVGYGSIGVRETVHFTGMVSGR